MIILFWLAVIGMMLVCGCIGYIISIVINYEKGYNKGWNKGYKAGYKYGVSKEYEINRMNNENN